MAVYRVPARYGNFYQATIQVIPRSPKTIKIIGFHQRYIVLVGNFNHPKLGTIILIVLDFQGNFSLDTTSKHQAVPRKNSRHALCPRLRQTSFWGVGGSRSRLSPGIFAGKSPSFQDFLPQKDVRKEIKSETFPKEKWGRFH